MPPISRRISESRHRTCTLSARRGIDIAARPPPPTSSRLINYRSGSPNERIRTRSRLARAVLSAKGRRDLARCNSCRVRVILCALSRARYSVRIGKRDVSAFEVLVRLDFERRYVQILGDSNYSSLEFRHLFQCSNSIGTMHPLYFPLLVC